MSFNSFSFILIFLPIVLVGRFGLNHIKKEKLSDIFLIIASLVMYGFFSWKYVILLLISSLITFGLSKAITALNNNKKEKLVLVVGIIINLSFLFYYKYMDFFIENINRVSGSDFNTFNIIMPIGISFYTFSQIAFLADSYMEKRKVNSEISKDGFLVKTVNLLEYLLFITFFPKMVQGPIALPGEMITQFRDKDKRKFDADKFSKGMQLFIIGLSKKVLLGDNLAKIADYGFKYTYYMDTITGILVLLSYTFQIYFDFSGYCDMAEGVSLMLGIELPRNFESPYKATSTRNLWQRWHITLSRFFTRYVYYPLGGSRKGAGRTALNILFIFILSGLWHGANWTYILWGLVMGILVVWDNLGIVATDGDIKKHYLLKEKPLLIIPKKLGQILTFIAFSLSLIFFRSENLTYAFQMFKQLFFFTWPGFMYKTSAMLDIPENYLLVTAANLYRKDMLNYIYVACFIVLLLISIFVITRKNAREIVFTENYLDKKKKAYTLLLAILFVWSFISLSQVSTFIYFKY